MPITACSKTSGVLASLQCSVFPKRHVPSTALPSGHPITHTEPSAHLGPPCTHPACHSTLREQRVPRGVKWVEGRRVPHTSQEVWAGQPISPGCISQHGRLAGVGVTAWFLQPFLHLLQPGLQPVSLRAQHGGTCGDSGAMQGWGAVPASALHRLYLILHQPIAGRTLLAAGAQRVKEEVGLAPVTLVAHEARVAEAGAVLMALRGDGAQRGAVAGCSGGRKASRCGCQPCFRDKDAVPIPVTSAAPGREAKEAMLAAVTFLPHDTRLAGALPCQHVAPALPRPCWVALTAGTRSGGS